MKVEQAPEEFRPIIITLENRQDAISFFKLLSNVEECRTCANVAFSPSRDSVKMLVDLVNIAEDLNIYKNNT